MGKGNKEKGFFLFMYFRDIYYSIFWGKVFLRRCVCIYLPLSCEADADAEYNVGDNGEKGRGGKESIIDYP
jgi:hypothetical protein